ncbi:MAG TPA: hypothetical protein VFY48_12075 [Solirubrobacterales bacterium]|nr:hypothetical protein [Solirubrobacterales bacterium]
MEPPSPARLYAVVAGATLFLVGLLGFFDDRSWLNYLHLGSGALALFLASGSARLCALLLGVAYTGLAIFAFGDDGWLHLAVGVLGLAALAAGSEPRAQVARKRA